MLCGETLDRPFSRSVPPADYIETLSGAASLSPPVILQKRSIRGDGGFWLGQTSLASGIASREHSTRAAAGLLAFDASAAKLETMPAI
jgi:hypothetical protein